MGFAALQSNCSRCNSLFNSYDMNTQLRLTTDEYKIAANDEISQTIVVP